MTALPKTATPAQPGDIARARSALAAAQSDLHSVQLKLAPLRAREKRALERVAEASQRLRDAAQGQLPENAPRARSPASPPLAGGDDAAKGQLPENAARARSPVSPAGPGDDDDTLPSDMAR